MAGDGKDILIVEDEPFVVNVYKTKLSKEGFNVHVAEDGERGWQIAQEVKPDLILLDLILPKMNGFGVLENLKSSEELKTIPVLILSNLGQQSDIQKGLDLGAEDYLVKSDTSLKEVLEKIESFIN
jgi:DNA-binding response OmpR family regulator